jgi:hypothetical protein
MITVLIRLYRANPFRPHCDGSRHVALCRRLGLDSGNTRRPAKDA